MKSKKLIDNRVGNVQYPLGVKKTSSSFSTSIFVAYRYAFSENCPTYISLARPLLYVFVLHVETKIIFFHSKFEILQKRIGLNTRKTCWIHRNEHHLYRNYGSLRSLSIPRNHRQNRRRPQNPPSHALRWNSQSRGDKIILQKRICNFSQRRAFPPRAWCNWRSVRKNLKLKNVPSSATHWLCWIFQPFSKIFRINKCK